MLGLRAFGQCGIKIYDSRLFLNKLIGTMQLDSGFNHNLILQQFNSIINTKIKNLLMNFLTQKGISFLDVASHYEEISRLALEKLEHDFEVYGLELVNFFVESISPPKEQYAKLRQYKEELALGEGFYGKRRSFDVLEGLAQAPAGGMIAAGLGFGAGMYAAPSVGGVFGQLAQNINTTTTTASSQNSGDIVCPSCNQTVEAGSQFCRFCGQPLPQEKFCVGCGKKLPADAKFCSGCGRRCN